MKKIINLNISGTKISTEFNVLSKFEYFRIYLEKWNSGEELFIDSDPKIFLHLINTIRIPGYIVPIKHSENVENLRKCYSIDKIENPATNKLQIRMVSMYEFNNTVKNENIISIRFKSEISNYLNNIDVYINHQTIPLIMLIEKKNDFLIDRVFNFISL